MREIQEEVDHAREKRLLREKGEFLEMYRLKKVVLGFTRKMESFAIYCMSCKNLIFLFI